MAGRKLTDKEILKCEDCLRILLTIQKRSLRFSQIQKSLSINTARLCNLLKILRRGFWIIPHTIPTQKSRVLIEYRLSKRSILTLNDYIKKRKKINLDNPEF